MKEFSEIFNELVASIDRTISVTSKNSNQYTVNSLKWARVGKRVRGFDSLGNLQTKTITAINGNTLTLKDGAIVGDTLILDQPFNITGTRLATNIEWTRADIDLFNKTPIVWLLDNFTEVVYGRGDSREREINFTVFFLDETNIKDFYTAEHKSEVVTPMINLMEQFIDVINQKPTFKALELLNKKDLTKFGTETQNGFERNILDANLSGTSLTINVTKYKKATTCLT
jgi:hypothetical protein